MMVIKLDAEFDSACVTLLLSILTFLISEDPGVVTLCPEVWIDLHSRCLRVTPEAYGRKPMPIY